MVRELLKRAPTLLEAQDFFGNTPLLFSVHRGIQKVAESLLAAGAKPNVVNWSGFTPLMWAASNGHFELMKQLIDKGADVNYQNAFPGILSFLSYSLCFFLLISFCPFHFISSLSQATPLSIWLAPTVRCPVPSSCSPPTRSPTCARRT
jgi:ankyrin repeat protein